VSYLWALAQVHSAQKRFANGMWAFSSKASNIEFLTGIEKDSNGIRASSSRACQ
jgi:hypothetical protein